MTIWTYRYAGLRVDSDLRIPEWAPFERAGDAEPPDIRIVVEPVQLPRIAEPGAGPGEGGMWRIAMPEIGLFCVTSGREIRVHPVEGAGAAEIRLILLGSAWASLCHQRGALVLHMSVAEIEGRAFAFCGPSGSGKSSLAALLQASGHPLLCDDLCNLEVGPEGTAAHPGVPRIKLWRDALDALGHGSGGLIQDHFRMDKFHLPSGGEALRPLPLAAIYLLGWGDLQFRSLSGLGALRRLVEASAYRPAWLKRMGVVAGHWEACLQMAARTPLWEFQRPRDWAAKDALVGALLHHAQSIPRS